MTTNILKNNGLKIGTIFTVSSLLLTFTIVIPIVSVMPVGAFFEMISETIVSNDPYSNVAKLTTFFLALILLLIITLILTYTRKQALNKQTLSKGDVIGMMFAFYLIVHPLGFYVYWGLWFNFNSDGQLIFATLYSFSISSFAFLPFGLLLDWVTNSVFNQVTILEQQHNDSINSDNQRNC